VKHLQPAPLRIVKSVFDLPCNIGTEGHIRGYLCDNLDPAAPKKVAQVLLMVFIALYEDISLRLAIPVPASQAATSEALIKILELMKEKYLSVAVIERNSHDLLN